MMKKIFKLFPLFIVFLFFSCQTEESEITETDNDEELLVPGSTLANLLYRISLKDGSDDNIIDSMSLLSVQFPIQVSLNNQEASTIFSAEEIQAQIESYEDSFEVVYPISVTTYDYQNIAIENQMQLQLLFQDQLPVNDIECIDIQYPIAFSAYNTVTEQMETIVIENDEGLFNLLINMTAEVLLSFDYPVTVVLSSGSTITINSNAELLAAIEDAIGTCDEDDDPYDQESIEPALISCPWNFSESWDGGTIGFLEDGSLGGYTTTIEFFMGTWELQVGNVDILTIDVPGYEIEVEGSWVISEFYADESGYYLSLNGGQMILEQDCPLQTSCSTTITECEMGTEVGYAEFNLSEQDACMIELAEMEPETSAVYYYLTEMDAMNNTNTLFPESFINTTQFSQYVYVRVENINTGFYEIIVILLVTEDC